MNRLAIPEHMHSVLLKSKKWLWGTDFFFHYTTEFEINPNHKTHIYIILTATSKLKQAAIEELGLEY